jgi:hypothetical protein
LFAKFFPVINMAEVKSIVKATSEKVPHASDEEVHA